jgi:hypothetical protein
MKRILLASLCLTLGFLSKAQISKGSVLLGGNITFHSHIDEGDREKVKSTGIWITPSVAVAVKENTILGLQLGYSRSDFTEEQGYSTESNKYRSGIFLRKYFSLAERFYVFGEGNTYFDRLDEETKSGSSKTETKGWGYRPGGSTGCCLYVKQKSSTGTRI